MTYMLDGRQYVVVAVGGGAVAGRRGTEVTDFATEISAPTFFSRTFVIDHR